MTIEMVVCPRAVQISRDVIQVGQLFETLEVTVFRRQMQHAERRIEKRGALLHEGPNRAMSFQAQTVRGQCVGATADTPVRQHFAVRLSYDWVLQCGTRVRPCHRLQCQMRAALQHRPGHPSCQHTDQSHGTKIRRDPSVPP